MRDTCPVYEPTIFTDRLELHHIPAMGLISLYEEKQDVEAIAGRTFSNPFRVLVDDAGPLPWRVPQVKEDPELNRWFIRFIVERESREVIGSTSFHGQPDVNGMVEIGIGIEQKFHNRGYAKEAILGMWRWVCKEPRVKVLRYTVSPDNAPSVSIIKYFGFRYIGQQMDEIDGPEDIYELTSTEFLEKWGTGDER